MSTWFSLVFSGYGWVFDGLWQGVPAIITKLEMVIVLASAIRLLFLAAFALVGLSGFTLFAPAVHRRSTNFGEDRLREIPEGCVEIHDWLPNNPCSPLLTSPQKARAHEVSQQHWH
jgi:hypothetical protein